MTKTAAERYEAAFIEAYGPIEGPGFAALKNPSKAPMLRQFEAAVAAVAQAGFDNIKAAVAERDREWRAWENRQRANIRMDAYDHPRWADFDADDPPPDRGRAK